VAATSSDSGRRFGRVHGLSDLNRAILAHSGQRRGFVQTEVLTRWSSIVGPDVARHSCPEKITATFRGRSTGLGATLLIRVEGGAATEIQHLEPQLIERINSYFGYAAVAKLRLVQGPLPRADHRARTPPQPLSRAARAAIETTVAATEHSDVRAALASLGRHIAARNQAR